MKIIIVTVGKKHDKDIVLAVEKYQKRLNKFCELTWEYVTVSNVDSESSAILRLISQDDLAVLLDNSGEQISNEHLSNIIEEAQNNSIKRLVFVIGGAYGVNYSVIARANLVLSFSNLIFPHQLMRLILIEQIYRSYSILSGGNYHHE